MTAPLDAMVIGLPRSGTTLMSDLMTVPREFAMCYNEPQDDQMDDWRRLDKRPFGLKRFAIKQVYRALIEHTFDGFQPNEVIVMARDLRHVVLSAIEWYTERRPATRGQPLGYCLNQIRSQYPMLVATLLRVHKQMKGKAHVVRYEDLLDARSRVKVAQRIGWKLSGEPRFRLDHAWEWERHGGPFISKASVELRTKELEDMNAEVAQTVQFIEEKCRAYSEAFLGKTG